jgi:hypothetical protein
MRRALVAVGMAAGWRAAVAGGSPPTLGPGPTAVQPSFGETDSRSVSWYWEGEE